MSEKQEGSKGSKKKPEKKEGKEEEDKTKEKSNSKPGRISIFLFQTLPILLFYVATISIVLSFSSIHYANNIRCIGTAFFTNTSYGTGQGRCEHEINIASFLRKRAIMHSFTSYQGDFLNGVKHGNGLYTHWRAWNEFTLKGYEGGNKVQYNGKWTQNQRDGPGVFELWDGTSFSGNWTKNDLTNEYSVLTYRTISAQNKFVKMSTAYLGPVSKALPNGKGILRLGLTNYSTIEGEFQDGVLVKASQIDFPKKTYNIVHLDDTRSGNSHACKFTLKDTKETYEWDGSSLRIGETSLTRKTFANAPANQEVKDLFEFLEALCALESRILTHAPLVSNYNFELFEHISTRNRKNAILEF